MVNLLDWVSGLGDLASLISDRTVKRDDDRPAKRQPTFVMDQNEEPRAKHRLLCRSTRGLKRDD
ncbi:hypothetical protein J2Y54_000624 [Sphingomonas sp. BE123]|uniref:hypothetical protein n=1 Tax=Sphingomonas sp. BE123 TaxID=2817842 RepID=UPI002859690E|nr:hypothetical protein [Sphingomonas sp. BE123]MDR6851131.1 hypothetical protein [Sphingomonas sp. BE123]